MSSVFQQRRFFSTIISIITKLHIGLPKVLDITSWKFAVCRLFIVHSWELTGCSKDSIPSFENCCGCMIWASQIECRRTLTVGATFHLADLGLTRCTTSKLKIRHNTLEQQTSICSLLTVTVDSFLYILDN